MFCFFGYLKGLELDMDGCHDSLRMRLPPYSCSCNYVYICMCTCTHSHANTHTHTLTHTHMHTHTHTHTRTCTCTGTYRFFFKFTYCWRVFCDYTQLFLFRFSWGASAKGLRCAAPMRNAPMLPSVILAGPNVIGREIGAPAKGWVSHYYPNRIP